MPHKRPDRLPNPGSMAKSPLKVSPKASPVSRAASSTSGTAKIPVKATVSKTPRPGAGTRVSATRAQRPATVKTSSPIVVCAWRYSSEPVIREAQDGSTWEVAILHDAFPSATYNILQTIGDVLRSVNNENGDVPATLRLLQQEWHMRVVLPRNNDNPDGTAQRNVVAFYIAGDEAMLANLFNVIDKIFAYRLTAARNSRDTFGENPTVHYHVTPDITFPFSVEDMETTSTIHDPTKELPLPFWSASPPWGNRHLTVTFDLDEGSAVTLTFGGPTYDLRDAFQDHDVDLLRVDDNPDAPEYFRQTRTLNLEFEQDIQYITGLLTVGLRHRLMRAVWQSTVDATAAITAFKTTVAALPNVYFA